MTQSSDVCKVCGLNQSVSVTPIGDGSGSMVKCPRCGQYKLTGGALVVGPLEGLELHLLSGVIRDASEFNAATFTVGLNILQIKEEFDAKVLSMVPRTIDDKLERLMTYFARKSAHPGVVIVFRLSHDYPIAFCTGEVEFNFYLSHLEDAGLVRVTPSHDGEWSGLLTARGWEFIETLKRVNPSSKQAFVAMWFDASTVHVFRDGIMPVGPDTGFDMLRIDQQEFNEKICDRIVAEIRKSRFLIADVTGHRQGVYFEAGYAMGMGLPVIWTCNEKELAQCHFDTRQYNHIAWTTPQDLREKLTQRILATIR